MSFQPVTFNCKEDVNSNKEKLFQASLMIAEKICTALGKRKKEVKGFPTGSHRIHQK